MRHQGESRLAIPRRALLLGAAALAAPALVGPSLAQEAPWPNRPVRVIVAWPVGGGADTVSRILFARVGELLGQQFIIENRPGGTGTIGATAAARAPADGYTLLYDSFGQAVNPALMPNIPFDVRRDLMTVHLTAVVPNLLVVHPSVEARTVAEVMALAKATPGGLNWASSGSGSAQHMALELFRQMGELPLTHVPYRGGGPALNDVIAGQIKFYFSNASASTNHVRSGLVRAIAHTGSGRLTSLPEVPAMAETLPGFEASDWNGIFVPTGTPPAIVERLNAALNEASAHPPIAARLADLSVVTRRNSPAEFRAFLEAEMEKWGGIIRRGNIKLE